MTDVAFGLGSSSRSAQNPQEAREARPEREAVRIGSAPHLTLPGLPRLMCDLPPVDRSRSRFNGCLGYVSTLKQDQSVVAYGDCDAGLQVPNRLPGPERDVDRVRSRGSAGNAISLRNVSGAEPGSSAQGDEEEQVSAFLSLVYQITWRLSSRQRGPRPRTVLMSNWAGPSVGSRTANTIVEQDKSAP